MVVSARMIPVQSRSTDTRLRVCVVGGGTRFLSGISYYTHRLSDALARSHDVSVILMRQLLPTHLYPGRNRVGKELARLAYPPDVPVFDGVDWFWLPSIVRAVAFLVRQRPDVIVFEWWTGTVLHSYLLLMIVARLLGARIVIEFHEVLDTGEQQIPLARAYVRLIAPFVVRLAQGFVLHSEYDREALRQQYKLGDRPSVLVPHGPYDQYQRRRDETGDGETRATPFNLLYFGVIRPYKGLEDLITAFNMLPEEDVSRFHLTVVGETWEGWTAPGQQIAHSLYRDHITFVNRYVNDEEVEAFFAAADAVVLPYHRSSSSGPLHIAMSHGLPVVVTHVGGLIEAARGYGGAVFVPPHDPIAIRQAFNQVAHLRGQRFVAPHSWEHTVERFNVLFAVSERGTSIQRET